MKLSSLLEQHREHIKDEWIRRIANTYPLKTARFLREKHDEFANPVGSTLEKAITSLFSEIINECDPDRIAGLLDDIIRIRAVQDFSPSAAVAIVFMIKDIVRDRLAGEIKKGDLTEELFTFESTVDRIALLAFDVYMKCREKVWEIKMNDVMQRPFMLMEGAMCTSYMLRRGNMHLEKIGNDDEFTDIRRSNN